MCPEESGKIWLINRVGTSLVEEPTNVLFSTYCSFPTLFGSFFLLNTKWYIVLMPRSQKIPLDWRFQVLIIRCFLTQTYIVSTGITTKHTSSLQRISPHQNCNPTFDTKVPRTHKQTSIKFQMCSCCKSLVVFFQHNNQGLYCY